MAVNSTQVTVTTSATALTVLTDSNESGENYGRTTTLRNPTGGQTVFIGGSAGVTISSGFQLEPGQTLAVRLTPGETLFGIVAATTQVVGILSRGL